LYGIVSYVRIDADSDGGDFEDDTAAGDLGARFLLTDRIELNARMLWQDIGEEDDVGFGAGARFYLIERLSLGARVDVVDDDKTFAVGARFDF
jgi:hypothetical protein